MSLAHWLTPWDPSPSVVVATTCAALAYAVGALRRPVPAWRSLCFWSGLAGVYLALNTQINFYAQREFFIHRVQHTVLHHIAPFLIALSRPGAQLAAGIPAGLRRRLTAIRDWPPVAETIDMLNHPFIAASLFVGLILFWLIPPIHFVAMLDWRWYRVMNWGMAINGLMFWSLVLNDDAIRPAGVSAAGRIATMLAVVPPQIVIGALISFAPVELFLSYGICGRVIAGLSPVADQQIGGLILWIPAAMMSVFGVLIVIYREWLNRPD